MTNKFLIAPAHDSPPFAVVGWQAAAQEKRNELYESIPAAYRLPPPLGEQAQSERGLQPEDPAILSCGILGDLDIEITLIDDVSVLLDRIGNRRYTSVQVATAFCKRAAIAQQCTGCLTEFMYDKAIERATYLDNYLANAGRTVGLLHGLPVSLKVSACG